MPSSDVGVAFGKVVQILRKSRKISQDQLNGISRPYLSDIERGAVNPSIDVLFALAENLKVNPAELIALSVEKLALREIPDEFAPIDFIENKNIAANFIYDKGKNVFKTSDALSAAISANTAVRSLAVLYNQISGSNLFTVIDKKQTGSFLGAVFVSSMEHFAFEYLSKNPSQTGHPDLVPKKYVEDGTKYRWDQFPYGGIEIKTSCGNLPSGKTHALTKHESRAEFITGIVWKGHHNMINNLMGLYWDYYQGIPVILGGFYSNELVPDDYTNTVPKEGGGHTTNVCITKSSAIRKMGKNWVFVANIPTYLNLFRKKMHVEL